MRKKHFVHPFLCIVYGCASVIHSGYSRRLMASVYIQNIKLDRSLNNETAQVAETILAADVSGWPIA
jgi:hypothetical protein